MAGATTQPPENDVPVTIVGAGPVGMILAYQLHRLKAPFLLVEQSFHTTKWPKLDLTNCRSMEILRLLGLADDYRTQEGTVGQTANFDSLFVSKSFGNGNLLGGWYLPSVNVQKSDIQKTNDGTQPAEPGQRCSQIIFEAWLKKVILDKSQTSTRFGWKYQCHVEDNDGVLIAFIDHRGAQHTVRSKYLVACDGGGSRVRKTAGIKMMGGPLPLRFHLVHFRSQQLARELPFGRFWHSFSSNEAFLIDQDDNDTFTAHFPVNQLPAGEIDPHEVVYWTLGAPGQKSEIKIDEIFVNSEWTPNFAVAEQYHSDTLRVVLAGDAAHRNPPNGGYGMNSGLADAFDLSWRLAALVNGYGGDLLIRAYSMERRPMMIRALERSHRHAMEHVKLTTMFPADRSRLEESSPEADELRRQIATFLDVSGSDILDKGIELDLRYHSPIIYQDGTPEPEWDPCRYVPSTRPGSRAPHVFLQDGVTSIYDLFGPEWTLVQFIDDPNGSSATSASASELFLTIADKLAIPIKRVLLHREPLVHRIWERDIVLVRPDTHVAWRGSAEDVNPDYVEEILRVISGQRAFKGFTPLCWSAVEENFKNLVAVCEPDSGKAAIAENA